MDWLGASSVGLMWEVVVITLEVLLPLLVEVLKGELASLEESIIVPFFSRWPWKRGWWIWSSLPLQDAGLFQLGWATASALSAGWLLPSDQGSGEHWAQQEGNKTCFKPSMRFSKCICSNMLVKDCHNESCSWGAVCSCCTCQEFVVEHSWSFGIKSSHMIMPDAVAAQMPIFLGDLLCCARQCCYREY